MTAQTVEIFHRGKRVASHRRSRHPGRHTTVTAHMPRPHREYAEWTPRRLVAWANKTGPATAELIEQILTRRRHPTVPGIAIAGHAPRGSAAARPDPFPPCVAVLGGGDSTSRRRPGVKVCAQVPAAILSFSRAM